MGHGSCESYEMDGPGPLMLTDLLTANPDELLHAALTMTAQVGETAHWSQLAIILGRVDDGGWWATWEPNCASARAWAESELGIPPKDFITYIDLWRTMQNHQNIAGFDCWRTITKSKALLVRKIINAGGDPGDWLAQAHNLSATKLRTAIEVHLQHEVWTVVKIAMPQDAQLVFEEAMIAALPAALDQPPGSIDPEKAKDRAVRFQCALALAVTYLQTTGVLDTYANPENPAADPTVALSGVGAL